jgi:hypothetical protein
MDSFLFEALVYLTWGGFVQFICAVLAAPIVYLIAYRFSRKTYSELFRAYVLFNVFLLLWGCLGHYVFLYLTYEKGYISVDRLVDWYPFIPFGQWVLDQGFGGDWHGHLIGSTTLAQLRLVWFAIALPVWFLTFTSTRLTLALIHRLIPRTIPMNQRA